MSPERAVYVLWLLWIVSWHVAMAWTARVTRRDQSMSRPVTLILAILGFAVLLGIYGRRGAGPLIAWQTPPALAWTMVACLALAFAFMWWARIHLGRLWSGSIVLREGHRVVDSGPYGLVRHPIYTGLIAAGFFTLAIKGTWIAVAGFAILTIAFAFKARAEERFLTSEFGVAYDEYRKRVPMLVPFWPNFP
jgi:protein-S-isoprenylcysteine O-methyltransferase Ste14